MYKPLPSGLRQNLSKSFHNDLNSKDEKYSIAYVHLTIETFLNNNKQQT